MPFRTCEWENKTPILNLRRKPKIELRHTNGKWFVILKSFCYLVPSGDPDENTVFVIPGEDAPRNRKTKCLEVRGHRVIVPPNPRGGETDLASVPWFMWWLIASYGNHTKATLLHDSLIVAKGTPPVPRTTADRLLLTALREPGQKSGAFRHWLMWVAVSVFGTMRRPFFVRTALFVFHVFAVWVLLVIALVWAWGSSIWPDSGGRQVVIVAAITIAALLFLLLLGFTWRARVDVTGGWLMPMGVIAAVILVPLVREWEWSIGPAWSPRTLLLASLVLTLLGLLWGLAVDRTLWGWLWPTALIGFPIAVIPVALIMLSVGLVLVIDVGASLAAANQRERSGSRRGFQWPTPKPYRRLF